MGVRFGRLSRRTALLSCACGGEHHTGKQKSNSALDMIIVYERTGLYARGYTRTEVCYGRPVKPTIVVWYYVRVRVPSARRMHEAAHMPPGIRIFTTVNPPLEAPRSL